jgi:hypothetical protein
MIPELERVSDDWLAHLAKTERGFSRGFFSPHYVARFPCAVVRRDQRIIAFAVLWVAIAPRPSGCATGYPSPPRTLGLAAQSPSQDGNMSQKGCEIVHRRTLVEPMIIGGDMQGHVMVRHLLGTK